MHGAKLKKHCFLLLFVLVKHGSIVTARYKYKREMIIIIIIIIIREDKALA
jgi:hypothetical protein